MRYFLLTLALLLLSAAIAEDSRSFNTFDAKAQKFMKELNLPGLAVATINIDDEGKLKIWQKTYGYAILDTAQPVTLDTAFWLGSVTKTFTGFAVAKAIEEGLISLDDDVNDILSHADIPFQVSHPFLKKLSLRDLVTHSSGIVDTHKNWNSLLIAGDDPSKFCSLYNFYNPHSPLEEFDELNNRHLLDLKGFLFSYLSHDGLLYSPDNFSEEIPKYSNIGCALAGYLVSVATSKPLEDYLTEHLLAPLQMQSTFLNWPPEKQNDKFAVQYLTQKQVRAIPQYNVATWPDGGIRSSVQDLSLYLSKIMIDLFSQDQNEDSRLLRRENLNVMLNPQYSLSENEQIGIFWQTQKVKLNGVERELVGHDGEDPGAFTYMLFDPKEKVGIIILANGEVGKDSELHLNFIGDLFSQVP